MVEHYTPLHRRRPLNVHEVTVLPWEDINALSPIAVPCCIRAHQSSVLISSNRKRFQALNTGTTSPYLRRSLARSLCVSEAAGRTLLGHTLSARKTKRSISSFVFQRSTWISNGERTLCLVCTRCSCILRSTFAAPDAWAAAILARSFNARRLCCFCFLDLFQ